VELLNNLNRDFVKKKGDVSDLVVCPTDYSRLWAKTYYDGPLPTYGRTLDKNINVMYTGDVVCSDLTKDTMTFFNNLVQRPGYYWWNWPVSDYCRNYILQGPAYGLDTTLTTDDLVAIVSNPMEHGEASKLGLYGVADYGWNIAAYNPLDNWNRGLADLMPDDPEAYRLFAIHSADTETGYRRDESWETKTIPYVLLPPQATDSLRHEFELLTGLPERFNRNCHNQLLHKELKPWIEQLAKVGHRGIVTLDLLQTARTGNLEDIWNHYASTMADSADLKAFDEHRIGTMKLHPFYLNVTNDLIQDVYLNLASHQPKMYKAIASFPNASTSVGRLMLDADTTTHYTSGAAQEEGSWIGLDLLMKRPINEVHIRQGRNSVDDCDFFDHAVLEFYSAKDDKWIPMTEELVNQYDIRYTPADKKKVPYSQYVRLRRTNSDRTNWTTVRTFEVNPTQPVTEDPASARLVDENPMTAYYIAGKPVTIPVPEKHIRAILLTKDGATVNGKRYDAPFVDVTDPGESIEIAPGATVYEVCFFM
ncbi:MAG: beta-N-acetylglucosaminidase domain-containing protein, partial [Muribaculaceae bacterium]|nr:beta-N-acetylglucosaminidase domain-containing protein [Muribaculaceae bacterium]